MANTTTTKRAAGPRFTEIQLTEGGFEGMEASSYIGEPHRFRAGWPLFIVRQAWGMRDADGNEVDYEDLADGFGAGEGTHGDWSGIRDSSPEALSKMVERALNALFPERGA